KQSDIHRKRRLVARLAAFALDRIEQRRFFAANVSTGAEPQFNVERKTSAENIRTQELCGARSLDRDLNAARRQRILAPDVKVAVLAARCAGRDGHSFDDGEGVAFHED